MKICGNYSASARRWLSLSLTEKEFVRPEKAEQSPFFPQEQIFLKTELAEIFRSKIPIRYIPEGLYIIGAYIAIINVISMFPHVASE